MSDPILMSAKAKQARTARLLKDYPKPKKNYKALKHTDLTAFSTEANKAFIRLTTRLINRFGGKVSIHTVYQEASSQIGISPETPKRYMFAHSAEFGPFAVFNGEVFFNSKYGMEDVDDDEEEEQGKEPE